MTLRIQKSEEHGWVVITLTGRIQGEVIPELRELLRSSRSDHRVVLDLKEVRLVDRDAVHFLALTEAGGAKLRNCSAFVREWISQERGRIQLAQVQSSDSSSVRE